MNDSKPSSQIARPRGAAWNKGKLTGAKPPLRQGHVWSIRAKLLLERRRRDLALFNLAIDSKLRGCDVVALRVEDVAPSGYAIDRATVRQKKTGQPRRVGTRQVEQIWRELAKAEQDLPGVGMVEQCVERGRLGGFELGKPVAKALFGIFGSGDIRPRFETGGKWMSFRVSRRGCVHATFCGTSGVWAASLSPVRAGSTSVATRPGCSALTVTWDPARRRANS